MEQDDIVKCETIQCAAIKFDELICWVPRPGRHCDIIRKLAKMGCDIPIVGEQGFVTNTGRFVDRVTAGEVAVSSGQTKSKVKASGLYSEDLW